MNHVFAFFILFVSSTCICQQRVSNIEHITMPDDYKRWITLVDSTEYLIEQGEEETRIGAFHANDKQILHSLTYRPVDQRKIFSNSSCQTDSPLMLGDRQLIEVYTNVVTVTSIVEGVVEHVFEFTNDTLSFNNVSGSLFGTNLFLVAITVNGKYQMVTIDLKIGSFEIAPYLFPSRNINRINDFIYIFENTGLKRYNLISHVEEKVLITDYSFDIINRLSVDCSYNLIFCKKGDKVYSIDENNHLDSTSCFMSNDVYKITRMDSIYVVSYQTNNAFNTKIYNFNECKMILDTNVYMQLVDIPLLNNQYLLLSIPGGTFQRGKHYLLDIINGKLHLLLGDYLPDFYTRNFTYHGGKLYIEAIDDDDSGYYSTLNIIDPSNFTTNRIEFGTRALVDVRLILRDFTKDSLHVIVVSENHEVDLWDVNADSLKAKFKYSLLEKKNTGIKFTYPPLEFDNGFFSSMVGGIYYTKGNQTIKLFSHKYSSKMVIFKTHLFALVQLNDTEFGYVKISLSDFNVQYRKLKGINKIHPYHISTPYAFINLTISGNDSFYFDLKTEKWKTLYANNFELRAYKAMQSNDKVYMTGSTDFGPIDILLNTKTDVVTTLSKDDYFTYPDSRGSFFKINNGTNTIEKWISGSNYSSLGTFPDFNLWQYYSPDEIQNKSVVNIPLQIKDAILVVSDKDGVIKQNIVPYPGITYYSSFEWKESGESVLVETYNTINNQFTTWAWKFGQVPLIIPFPHANYRIARFYIDDNDLVILYKERDRDGMKLLHYDMNTRTVKNVLTLTFTKNLYSYLSCSVDRIGKYTFAITYNDGIHGFEPWIYDVQNYSFEMAHDVYSGQFSSSPFNYQVIDGECYFAARDNDRSVQFFKLISSTPSDDFIGNEPSMKLYPNPVSDLLHLNYDNKEEVIELASILDVNGKIVSRFQNLGNSVIDVSSLSPGTYVLIIQSKLRNISARFIKL